MEVVFLSVADEKEKADEMSQRCRTKSVSQVKTSRVRTVATNVRAADAFLPKYLFRYHAIGPAPEGSGAGPRGSRS